MLYDTTVLGETRPVSPLKRHERRVDLSMWVEPESAVVAVTTNTQTALKLGR